jgi:hypothetical protein
MVSPVGLELQANVIFVPRFKHAPLVAASLNVNAQRKAKNT